MKKLPTLALVGRPNVGKSTLFNRIIGRKEAIVHDQPGVTRDRHYGIADWAGRSFRLIDTGGYEPEPESDLFEQMRRQVEIALREADLILFIVDGRVGLAADDREMAARLRKLQKPVILVVNKVDETRQELESSEFFELGIPEVQFISAEHGRRVGDLLDAVIAHQELWSRLDLISPSQEKVPKIAILGRPNVGKSTLLNRLFGAPRAVVHPEPGTTRDPLNVQIEIEGQSFEMIDTAGIRKKSHAEGKIEKVSVMKSLEMVAKSDLVILLVDGTIGITSQDGKVAQMAIERFRPLLILVNKWDVVQEKYSWEQVEKKIEAKLQTLQYVPMLPLSAKTGFGIPRVFRRIRQVMEEYSKRLPTHEVNRAFQEMMKAYPPPLASGRALNLSYMTQIGVEPPHFIIFANHPRLIPEAYKRYLTRGIRNAFRFSGSPIKLTFKGKRKKDYSFSKGTSKTGYRRESGS